MALLSSGHFPDLEETVVFTGNENSPTSLGSDRRCSFRYGDLPFTVSVVSPTVAVQSIGPITDQAEDEQIEEEHFNSKYILSEDVPSTKFSVLRCCQKDAKQRTHYKNFYTLSIIFILLIVAHDGLVGIETTLNLDQGRVTLAVENTLFVSSVVLAPAVIWLLGIRDTMLLACILQVGYISSNYLRSYYTLIPGAIIGGFSLGMAWVAASLYLSVTSTNLGIAINVRPTIAIGKFGGIFFMFISIGLMIGNIFSSIFFILEDELDCDAVDVTITNITGYLLNNSNGSASPELPVCLCDIGYGIRDESRYILVSIYVLIDILAIILLLLTVNQVPRLVPNDGELKVRILRYLKNSVLSIIRVHLNTKVSLLIPIFMLGGLQAGYYLGSFTTDFIAQCVGVRFVGFGVAVWAFGSAIGSFVFGRVVKYIRRFTLFFTSTVLSVSLCLFLIFFGREDSFTLVFLVSLGFGLSDGILKTGISCLISGRFYKLRTTVFSILRMWIGVGLTTHFALSIVVPRYTLLWIIVGAAGIGMPLYGLVDRNVRFLYF